jgi:hypothetical protein
MAHKVFVLFLILVGAAAATAIGLRGISFYLTPVHLRPFRQDYELMKASGEYSHGLGIVGATLIVIGVSTYSTRKRVRSFWSAGKLSRWLEFHITLCLLGPILIVYHTTFKAGGVAAISLWTMLSVVASGFVGRFLYALIPRDQAGTELSSDEIKVELERMDHTLASTPVGSALLHRINQRFAAMHPPSNLSSALETFVQLRSTHRDLKLMMRRLTLARAISVQEARLLFKTAAARASLVQRSIILGPMGKLFNYWHAIHLPFTVIMFLTLAAHVTVTVLLGYRWIF